jgi:hypothetical protein
LLARYPSIPGEIARELEVTSIELEELSTPQIVDLDDWFIPVAEIALVSSLAPEENDNAEPAFDSSPFEVAEATVPAQAMTETQLALTFQ